MAVILVVYAHPYPSRSLTSAPLVKAVADLPGVRVRSLYELYPDFDIDAEAERAAVAEAQLLVWIHPLYWFAPPALMQLWFEVVLAKGWAWGDGGNALRGKDCLWVTTTGGVAGAFSEHQAGPIACAGAVEQTARFCGLDWLEPLAFVAARNASREQLDGVARELRARLERWIAEHARA